MFIINPAFEALLTAAGLESLEGVMAVAGGGAMGDVPGCLTDRLEMDGSTFYLKRHRPPSPVAPSAGTQEWKTIKRLTAAGIPCPKPVAAGAGRVRDEPCSFIMTQAIAGGIPLDDFCRRRFRGPLSRTDVELKMALIAKLTGLVRRLHRAGFCHNDLCLCHVFVHESDPINHDFVLIDLRRVKRSGFRHRRWLVLDLAALNYTATRGISTRSDQLRFLLHYLEIRRPNDFVRRLAASVLLATEEIRHRDA